jgi:hypothetical protein
MFDGEIVFNAPVGKFGDAPRLTSFPDRMSQEASNSQSIHALRNEASWDKSAIECRSIYE